MKIELKPDHDWEYRKEVDNFGGAKPDFAFNNQNVIQINWSDVKTDGKGNVLDMPLLTSKLCFGRIEFRFRHERPDRETTNYNGKEVKSTNRCIRCPASTKHSCKMLIAERVASDPVILETLQNWKSEVDKVMADPFPQHPQKIRSRQFVGDPFGYLWQSVRYAIVNRGRFENSNDKAVKEQIEEVKRRDREKQMLKMRARREEERRELQAKQEPPPTRFVKAAWDECFKRKSQLLAARKVERIPRQISTLTDQGCELTAYAWYYGELVGFQDLQVQPGKLARWLVESDLAPGQSIANLKTRLKRDSERAQEIEKGIYGHIWQPFDPDADLEF